MALGVGDPDAAVAWIIGSLTSSSGPIDISTVHRRGSVPLSRNGRGCTRVAITALRCRSDQFASVHKNAFPH